jgi:nicotinamidase-related amidase
MTPEATHRYRTYPIDATPFPFSFDLNHCALLCVDMQRDFILPGGFADSLGNPIGNLQPCIPVIKRLQEAFRSASLPIIHTKECHKPDLSDLPVAKRNRGNPGLRIGDRGLMGRILIDGEEGSDFIDELAPREDELVISKPGKDTFYSTDFRDYLVRRNISNLIVTGVTTEVCVQTTVRAANDRGYDCLLVEDGTESYFPEFKEVTLRALTAQGGIAGYTAPSEKVLSALEGL